MLASYEAQILHDEFYLRIQQCLVIRKLDVQQEIHSEPSVYSGAHLSLEKHFNSWKKDWQKSRDGTFVPELLRCSECEVEYIVDFKPIGDDDGFAFVLSKWLNMGNGLNPYSKAWRRHAEMAPNATPVFVERAESSIMRRFEKSSAMSLLERTTENGKHMSGEFTEQSMVCLKGVRLPHFPSSSLANTWIQQIDTRPSRP
jgi:hypothetical protein